MTAQDGAGVELVEVQIRQLPLDVYRRSQQHHDELFREFALIAFDRDQTDSVPARLLALIDDLTGRFGSFTAGTSAEVEAAIERGDETVDVTFEVPRDVSEACRAFRDLLAEADAFCEQGDLLTLKPPPEAIAFREWYLEEFIRQEAGGEPRPWASFAGSS